jgi:hypothetical protein
MIHEKNELTTIDSGYGYDSDSMNCNFSGYMFEEEQKLLTDPERQQQIQQIAMILELTKKQRHDYHVSIIDLDRELEDFLNSSDKSKATKKSYKI